MKPSYIAWVLFLAATCGQAQEQPHIRVDVNLVNVAFSVRDARGGLSTNLTRDDFEALEDGVPQKIAFFARSGDVPLTLGLIVDFSGSQDHFLKPHHRDLQTFLKDVMGPRDQAFLVCFGNHLRLVSELSGSITQLIDGLQQFDHKHRDFPELGPPDEDRESGTAFYDSIYYSITEKLATVATARKALILFGDGEDNSSSHHMMDAIEAAQSHDVLVYAIRYTQRSHRRLTARNKYGTSVMARVARETGGADYDALASNLGSSFQQIGEELRSLYELAYVTTNPVRDGSFRKIVIRSKQSGFTVRSKTGYYPSTAEAPVLPVHSVVPKVEKRSAH